MRAVGRIFGKYGKRMLILTCDPAQLPRLYSDVVDRKLRPVGKVVDVFGNVSAPYAAVFCHQSCETPTGEKLYTK